jgi:hypothetical protein
MRALQERRAVARCLTTDAGGVSCRELGAPAVIARMRESELLATNRSVTAPSQSFGVDIARTNALGSDTNQQKVMLLEEKLL